MCACGYTRGKIVAKEAIEEEERPQLESESAYG